VKIGDLRGVIHKLQSQNGVVKSQTSIAMLTSAYTLTT
jgi:hypothetical protein